MVDFAGLQTLTATLQNVVTNLANLTKQVSESTAAIFPQSSGVSMDATAGSATLPANPVGFLTVKLPDGTSVKLPYYA